MKKWWIIGLLIFISLLGYSQEKPEQKSKQGTESTIKKVPLARQNKNTIQKTQTKKKQIQKTQVQRRKAQQIARKRKAVKRR